MTIRIAVSQLPQMLADIVREAFSADPDITVEDLAELGGLSAAPGRAEPDVLLVGGGPDCDLLLDHPRLVLLSLSTDGRRAWVCELRPQARELGEVSLAGLRSAVRDAVQQRRGVARGFG